MAILSTTAFNAVTQVEIASLTFGATGDEPSLAFCDTGGEDVNGDGLLDLVCHFETQRSGFLLNSTTAVLKGRSIANVPISGAAAVTVVH